MMCVLKMIFKAVICILVLVAVVAFPIGSIENNYVCNEDVHVSHLATLSSDETHIVFAYQNGTYINYCWRCKADINSNYNRRCSKCGWYICNNCGACKGDCPRCPEWKTTSASSRGTSSKKSGGGVWGWIILIGIVAAGIYLYYKNNYA